jgi:hypothetical protein
MVAARINAAPIRSSRWGRSWRGSARSARSVSRSATSPSGRLIQKINDQCSFSANTPPRTGPITLDATNTDAIRPW